MGFPFRKNILFVIVFGLLLVLFVVNLKLDAMYKSITVFSWASGAAVLLNGRNHTKVIFIETSGSGIVEDRHLLSMESAATWNPEKEIRVYIFTNKTVEPTKTMVELTKTYDNLKFIYLDMDDYVRGTLLEEWYNDGTWRTSISPPSHSSDGLRLLTLWKDGGIYMDFDIITIKYLKFPKNTLTFEKETTLLSSGLLAFQRKHPFLEYAMRTFVETYDPKRFSINGPPLITKTYEEFCVEENRNCDIVVLPFETANPVVWAKGSELFAENLGEETMKKFSNSSAVHWWNGLFHKSQVTSKSNSAFSRLAKRNAPVVYKNVLTAGHF